MLTVNDFGKKKPYTYKETIEIHYPEIWETAHECLKRLEIWQNMLVELLPDYKRRVPDNLKLRSLYGLASFIWEKVNLYCHQLASGTDNQGQVDKDAVLEKLIGLFEAFDQVDIFDIVKDSATGFQKLEQAFKGFGDYPVLAGYMFSDILGIVNTQGWNNDGLCTAVKEDTTPSETNLGGFMDSEEDNRMVIIY